MKDFEPDKPVLPKVPIPVEESKAQRLQRSQARFRDRGGIFVPTARNTLVDILLGRKVASPKKGRRRSASLSPKKKAKSGLLNNIEEVKAVRTSPRKAAQRREPEAAMISIIAPLRPELNEVREPSDSRDVVLKHKATKKSEKKAETLATATSKAKVKGDSAKPVTKKRGRKPKTTVQEVERLDPPDPSPLAKSQLAPKKSRTKSVSKKPARLGESKKGSSIESPEPKKSAKATSKTALDADTTKSFRASTSKNSTTSKQKPTTSVEPGPAPLQQLSTGAGPPKTKKASVSDDDQRTNKVHQECSREGVIAKGKGKKKVPQTNDPGDKLDVTLAKAQPKSRKKRARPADSESESECPSPSKRVKVKQAPSEETKSKARQRKTPTAQKDTIKSKEETIGTKTRSKSPSKKRAREPDDERPGAKHKKTKGTVDVTPSSDGAVPKQAKMSKEPKERKAEKTKKPSTSKTSRAKKGTTQATKVDKAPAETNTETSTLIISRIRPRKSVIIRMKHSEQHQMDDDPDPINFLT